MIKIEFNLFLIALTFLTRIPVSGKIDYSQKNLNHASRYFSLIGWCIGGICSLIFLLFESILPIAPAIILSMLVSMLLTGSFHEDGLADTCDGLGGGWTKQQKLEIMKDSRLGTYGAVAIWFVLSFKFVLLDSLGALGGDVIVIALLVAHPLSRSISTCLIFFLPYVADESNSKVKPLAEKQHFVDFGLSLSFGFLTLFLAMDIALILIITLLANTLFLGLLFKKQIGGFTGDTLGATQQISELVIYLILLIFLPKVESLTLIGGVS